ncbi:unnamed protein product, partial [Linum tenue]
RFFSSQRNRFCVNRSLQEQSPAVSVVENLCLYYPGVPSSTVSVHRRRQRPNFLFAQFPVRSSLCPQNPFPTLLQSVVYLVHSVVDPYSLLGGVQVLHDMPKSKICKNKLVIGPLHPLLAIEKKRDGGACGLSSWLIE